MSVAMDSKVLAVETSLKRVVLLSIPDLTGILFCRVLTVWYSQS